MATTAVRPRAVPARDNPAYQAYLILRTGFVVAPILFGLDKFTNLLTDWTTYLAPAIDRLIPGTATTAMVAVGAIEIVAGLVVAVRPKFGGYLVAAWLAWSRSSGGPGRRPWPSRSPSVVGYLWAWALSPTPPRPP